MAGRHCSICTDSEKMLVVSEMLATGAVDQAVADRIGVNRMAVSRHRRGHLIKPMMDRLAIMNKGAAPKQERQQIAAAAAADVPSPQAFVDAFLGLKAQAEKLQRIEERLERMAALAESNESANGVAQISAQQLRGVEVGAKLAGAGGYAAPKAGAGGEGAVFSVNIMFGGGQTVETISVNAEAPIS